MTTDFSVESNIPSYQPLLPEVVSSRIFKIVLFGIPSYQHLSAEHIVPGVALNPTTRHCAPALPHNSILPPCLVCLVEHDAPFFLHRLGSREDDEAADMTRWAIGGGADMTTNAIHVFVEGD